MSPSFSFCFRRPLKTFWLRDLVHPSWAIEKCPFPPASNPHAFTLFTHSALNARDETDGCDRFTIFLPEGRSGEPSGKKMFVVGGVKRSRIGLSKRESPFGRKKKIMSNQEIYQKVTAIITEELKNGVAPWKIPYKTAYPFLGANKSAVSGKRYSGINAIVTYLVAQKRGYSSCAWATFNQWKSQGRLVAKNEKGTPILFYQMIEKENEEGQKESIPCAKYFHIFNENQLERDQDGYITSILDTPNLKAESVLSESPLKNILILKGRPAYQPLSDSIYMPLKFEFKTEDSYYSTLFHEIAHATGHETRLDRDSLKKIGSFGDHSYSKEELVAEMTSAFLQGVCGIESELSQSASYCESWLRKLEHEPNLFVSAASLAQKAADFILNTKTTVQPSN